MELEPMATHGDSAPIHKPPSTGNNNNNDVQDTLSLYKALDGGVWEEAKKFLDRQLNLLTASLTKGNDIALHIATLAGGKKIVEELVRMMPAQDLEARNDNGDTALAIVAAGGSKKIAEFMLTKNEKLISIANSEEHFPVVIASRNDRNVEMVRYLYRLTPKAELRPERSSNKGRNGATLLTNCILAEIFDIALDLLQLYPKLAITPDIDDDTAIKVLAQKPSGFQSGSQLRFWQSWIYSCIQVQQSRALNNIRRDIESPYKGLIDRENMITQALNQLLQSFWNLLKSFVPDIKHIYDEKSKHDQALELLHRICQVISTVDVSQFKSIGVNKAVSNGIRYGIVELIDEIINCHPDIKRRLDQKLFFRATEERQEKIFNLLYKMGARKNLISTSSYKRCGNMLYKAAKLAPSYQLDRVNGAALQMQRELQWFKEVEKIVQPKSKATKYGEGKTIKDGQGQTPREIFTKEHEKLVEDGKKWLTDTATSSTVVAALIATIMFSAAFTVPGGYNATGSPLYLHQKSFTVFIVSDALSLLSSSTSVLMFLGILTSRCREEDFLKSLPTKLIIGLSLLFFSIATMMITFGTALVILLREAQLSWIPYPIIIMASIPVTVFALLQFPLLVQIFISTYRPAIFDSWEN